MTAPKVSVIVPVYNTERYVRKCLNSLLNQTLEEIEIIVVNDGSTDHSQDIIDEFVHRSPHKFVSVMKENGGLGDARNSGIQIARGEYIGFVDSDDWVEPSCFEIMHKTAASGGHDIVICDFMGIVKGRNKRHRHVGLGFAGSVFNHRQAVLYSTDPAFACNKMIKRDLFHKCLFSSKWYEDVGTIPVLMTYAQSPGYVRLPLYCYRRRPESITSSNDSKTLQVMDAWERILQLSNPDCKEEAIFAVAKSIGIFMDFKPQFSNDFLTFARKYEAWITQNKYYIRAKESKEIKDIFGHRVVKENKERKEEKEKKKKKKKKKKKNMKKR